MQHLLQFEAAETRRYEQEDSGVRDPGGERGDGWRQRLAVSTLHGADQRDGHAPRPQAVERRLSQSSRAQADALRRPFKTASG